MHDHRERRVFFAYTLSLFIIHGIVLSPLFSNGARNLERIIWLQNYNKCGVTVELHTIRPICNYNHSSSI